MGEDGRPFKLRTECTETGMLIGGAAAAGVLTRGTVVPGVIRGANTNNNQQSWEKKATWTYHASKYKAPLLRQTISSVQRCSGVT